jgi:hypothetical protein
MPSDYTNLRHVSQTSRRPSKSASEESGSFPEQTNSGLDGGCQADTGGEMAFQVGCPISISRDLQGGI